MSCTFNNPVITGDVNNHLLNAVNKLSNDNMRVSVVLSSYLNNKPFVDSLLQSTNETDILKVGINDLNNALKEEYLKNSKSIDDVFNEQNNLDTGGFSSITAKMVAINHTSNLLLDSYVKEIFKDSKDRANKSDLVQNVIDEITNNFDDSVNVLMEDLKSQNIATSDIETMEFLTLEHGFKLDELNDLYDSNVNNDRISELEDDLDRIESRHYVLQQNLVNNYGNTIQKNYATLLSKVRANPGEWFNQSLAQSKLSFLANDLKTAVSEEKTFEYNPLDDIDLDNPNSHSIDDMTKIWGDKQPKSYNRFISSRVKIILSNIPKLLNTNLDSFSNINELGVTEYMDANQVILAIMSINEFSSVEDFINGIRELATNNPNYHGLLILAQQMSNDVLLANQIFSQLNNPRVNVSMVNIRDNNITFDNSNRNSDKLGSLIFGMHNQYRNGFNSSFRTNDTAKVDKFLSDVNNAKNDKAFYSAIIKDKNSVTDNFIIDTLQRYFPNIDRNSIINYLHSDPDNSLSNYRQILTNIQTIIRHTGNIIFENNKLMSAFSKEKKAWNRDRKESMEARAAGLEEGVFNKPEPVFDNSSIKWDIVNSSINEIAEKISPFSVTKIELNSVNAEGNMTSDLVDNSYITNLIKRMKYGNEKESNAGAKRLYEFFSKSAQHRRNPYIFTTKNEYGKVVSKGLFTVLDNGEYIVNNDVVSSFDVQLFNGIRDYNNFDSAMYNNMSPGDYFITRLLAYEQPFNNPTNLNTSVKLGGNFLSTPSDSTKNFVVSLPIYSTDKLLSVDSNARQQFIRDYSSMLDSYNYNNEDVDGNNKKILKANNKNNRITIDELFRLLDNDVNNKKFMSYYKYQNQVINDTTVRIPLYYTDPDNGGTVLVWIEGTRNPTSDKKIINNIKISEIYTINEDNINKLSGEISSKLVNIALDRAISSNNIDMNVNMRNDAASVLKNQMLGELETFFEQLNTVMENVNGTWTSKTNTTNFIERYHFNNEVVKDGRFTGNAFSIIRLFNINGINFGEMLLNELNVYNTPSKGGIINKSKGKLVLNPNSENILNLKDGRIKLAKTNVVNDILNRVVSSWITEYSKLVRDEYNNYSELLRQADIKRSYNQVFDAMVNSAISEMIFDDLLYGDSKFYKDSQTFLKRAKQVIAGGKSYTGFDSNSTIGAPIQDLYMNGATVPIQIKGQTLEAPNHKLPYENVLEQLLNPNPTLTDDGNLRARYNNSSLVARNGFRAVTANNVTRGSEHANSIQIELVNILTADRENGGSNMNLIQAQNLAAEIANVYRNEKGSIAADDGQSYITLNEFIRRKHADGTLNEYEDILQQLLNPNLRLQDLDISAINAKIQIQKNFYFDQQFDESSGVIYPRQIKNSEFVLIPALLPEGSSLRQLHDIMEANDIGQFNTTETSKASKKNIISFWDENGNANPEAFANSLIANGGIAIENYYYEHLYKQLEVPQHMEDETNKVAIQLFKRLLDNPSPTTEQSVNNLIDSYVANIKDSFDFLLNEMNWQQNPDGSFTDKSGFTNADGDVMLNFDEFYSRARVEAERLGMDSNFIEFLTPINGIGTPIMPNFLNNVSAKLESVAQSIFNNSITRQTLPGWHAAQLSNVGFNVGVDQNGNEIRLSYHPEVVDSEGNVTRESYAEVMLPSWSNLIPKGYPLDKIAEEGLDIHIGYRVPTEGKQSISRLKIVGILDSTYGSTIIVPDEWVTQTGSDFDVDSVYGLSYEMVKDYRFPTEVTDYTLRKLTADLSDSEQSTRKRYINHVNSLLKNKVKRESLTNEFINDKHKEAINDIYSNEELLSNDALYKQLQEDSNPLFKELSLEHKNIVKNINYRYRNSDIADRYEVLANTMRTIGERISDNNEVLDFADQMEAIAYTLSFNKDFVQRNFISKSDVRNALIERIEQERFEKVVNAAKELNLISYEDFSQKPILEQISRKARNNIILDSINEIMNDPSSREENYSTSNFRDVMESTNRLKVVKGITESTDSRYSPFTQIKYMDNAMSTVSLKGISVSKNTFLSIANRIGGRLSERHYIRVKYDLNKYDLNTLINAYGENSVLVNTETNQATIIHNRIGNSNNNRNVVNKLITTYNSQLTAHSMDIIKEGTIPNENEFTYGVLSALVSVGVDYDTAISFLMQPGIDRIISEYHNTNSIYVNSGGNNITKAIKMLLSDNGITNRGAPITRYTLMTDINKILNINTRLKEELSDIFGEEYNPKFPIMDQRLSINRELLEQRLEAHKNNTQLGNDIYRNLAIDLAVISQFNHINNTSNNISSLINISNPDKFGAKTTIKSTRDTLDKILNYSDDTSNIGNTVMDSNGIPYVKSIYPIDLDSLATNNTNIILDENDSTYKYLAAFLKYVTIPNVKINSQLFDSESDLANIVIKEAERKLGILFTDEQYKEYKQYMVSDVFNNVPFLSSALTIDESGRIIVDSERTLEATDNNEKYWDAEKRRIFGYDQVTSSSMPVQNLHRPTPEEISRFNKLTPAQKVIFMQANFTENSGIFGLLDVNLSYRSFLVDKGMPPSTIRYKDQVENIEELLNMFRAAFFNSNPFSRLTAIDLVKYAYVVEGNKFKKGGINKIIPNDVLYKNIQEKGMNLIAAIQQSFNIYTNPTTASTTNFVDKFVRSHSNMVSELKIQPPRVINGIPNIGSKFRKLTYNNGLVEIPFIDSNNDLLNLLGLKPNTSKRYVRITSTPFEQKQTVLYKVTILENAVYLSPMNLLERNEVADYSSNPENNKFPRPAFYSDLINHVMTTKNSLATLKGTTDYVEYVKGLGQVNKRPLLKSNLLVETSENINELSRIINTTTNYNKPMLDMFIEDVSQYLNNSNSENPLRFGLVQNSNALLRSLIPHRGAVQVLQIDGSPVKVFIKPYRLSKKAFMYINTVGDNAVNNIINKVIPEEQSVVRNAINSRIKYPEVYRIDLIADTEIKEGFEDEYIPKEDDTDRRNAFTNPIADIDIDSKLGMSSINDVSTDLFNEIYDRSTRDQDEGARMFITSMTANGVDRYSSASLNDNKSSIYTAANKYYTLKSQELNNIIDNFNVVDQDGNEFSYSINDPELYNFLSNNPEYFPLLLKTVLDAKTFGGRFYDIFNLNLNGETVVLQNAINSIKKSINNIRTNPKVSDAINLIFNKYMAENYSTNPNIRRQIVTLTDIFGDTDAFDLWFSNITELNNTQVQTVVKAVNSMLSYATQEIAPRALVEFNREYNKIKNMPGELNMDKVIDAQGKFFTDYTDNFLKDRQEIAKKVKDTELQYGRNSIQYHRAVLERDEWRAKNLNQEILPAYYNRYNAIRRNFIDAAPDFYVDYRRLSFLIYNNGKKTFEMTSQEKIEYQQAINEFNQLMNPNDLNGQKKSPEVLKKVAAASSYNILNKELNDEFFEDKENFGFSEVLDTYLNRINTFDKSNPGMTLDNKLKNDEYREAYDWVNENSNYKLDAKSEIKLSNAFNAIENRSNHNQVIRHILKERGKYDKSGNLIASSISKSDREIIKEQLVKGRGMSRTADETGGRLIKDSGNDKVIIKKGFFNEPSPTKKTHYQLELEQTYDKINKYLNRVVDENGRIKTKDIFEKLTNDEIEELAKLYVTIKLIRQDEFEVNRINRVRRQPRIKAPKRDYTFATNEDAFREELAYANANLNTKQLSQWARIFTESGLYDKELLQNKANHDVYGYLQVSDRWIDHKKMEALELIKDNVIYEPTNYYYEALNEAIDNGTYDEFMNDNHLYNPHTGKMELLPIWTTMKVRPNGSLNATYSYVPTRENRTRFTKKDKINPNYRPGLVTYKGDTGQYSNNQSYTPKEIAMRNYLQGIVQNYASTYDNKLFADKNFAPRRLGPAAKDAKWVAQQVLGTLGLRIDNPSEKQWSDKVDYINDKDAPFDMMGLLKTKAYRERVPLTPKTSLESDAQFEIRKNDNIELNKQIEADNLKIDNELLDRDWFSVFQDFITKGTEYNAKQRSKNLIYLLLEDIADREAYQVNALTGNVKQDKSRSTRENPKYRTTSQDNTYKLVSIWARRIMLSQYKKDSKLHNLAGVLQNITSAKYMMLNITGGIKNVTTGLTNIYGEVFARYYFNNAEWMTGNKLYMSNIGKLVADMYNDTTDNLIAGLAKKFKVVDFDNFTYRRPNETATNFVKRARDLLYSPQSMGEHYMQNSTMLAMLESNRIFTDVDGRNRLGSRAEYDWNTEMSTLMNMIQSDKDLSDKYKYFIKGIKEDIQQSYSYAKFSKDFNEEFLREINDKELTKKYISERKKALKKSRNDFKLLPKAMDQFELVDGIALIKTGSPMTGEMFGHLRDKVISVNEKIHGVYSKIGAASIESNWYGGLVMQYHKHIYPGVLKRFRTKGYYNEARDSVEVGSYVSLARFLSTEFEGIGNKFKNDTDGSLDLIKGFREVVKSAIDTVINIKSNYELMPEWERANISRIYGDLLGIASAMLLAIGIYMATDDEDLEESQMLATSLYLSQAMYAEAAMYIPWVIPFEAQKMWSSPIAAQGTPVDLMKGLNLISDWMFNDDFNINYTTGLYKGENKLGVLVYRNTPIYRVFQRLGTMTKNNSYYRINESSLDIKTAKGIADYIVPD